MRLACAALAAALVGAPIALGAAQTGPDLGIALARGEIDPATFDFGALRYAPGQTLVFLAAQTGAQTAIAAAHGRPNWPSVISGRVCLTSAEQMTIAGFDSALLATDAATWEQQKAAAEAAFSRYAASRDAVLAGGADPEFGTEAAEVALARRTRSPELQTLYLHHAADQLWRHALVFGAPRPYAQGLGKAGVVWLNARIAEDGCAIDMRAAAWLKQALATIVWFDTKTYGKDADQAAWLIAEHADGDPEVQRLALDRMGYEVIDQRSNAANFAYLWDRVALNSGRPQRYGTQMHCVGKTWAPVSPVEDLPRLDERRRWVGLGPEADYAGTGAKLCGG